ncbi:reactive intermediate/imine deaminase [Allocatelliglobosispora scoriae]|uniref:Reactive intermediate/imine deaminase n=1 Tax=Allocatelliglobosispora scoriae TaxID=643052 RepID=A0A841BLH2_9ACTN|nr:RidA family protein [Allocatelliglobosispora scoriae]MBB5868485.1 reactive intermediate/imine deaminase [Allocatelliglobosispora scoriae]
MPKKVIFAADAAPPGGPYSHAVVAGDHVYLSGACPVLADGTWVKGPFADQARAAFTNLARVAAAAGADLSQAVKVGVYLRDFADFPAMNEIYVEFFGTENLPVRTTIPVALDGFDIEIDAILYTGA